MSILELETRLHNVRIHYNYYEGSFSSLPFLYPTFLSKSVLKPLGELSKVGMHTVGLLSGLEQGKNCIHMEKLPEQGCWTPSRGEGCLSKHSSGTVSENKQCEKGVSSGRLLSMGVRLYMGYRKHPGGKGVQPGLVV